MFKRGASRLQNWCIFLTILTVSLVVLLVAGHFTSEFLGIKVNAPYYSGLSYEIAIDVMGTLFLFLVGALVISVGGMIYSIDKIINSER
jgi:hypothetical protein